MMVSVSILWIEVATLGEVDLVLGTLMPGGKAQRQILLVYTPKL